MFSREVRTANNKSEVTGYKCLKLGHYAKECTQESFVVLEPKNDVFKCTGAVNDIEGVDMIIDTGCFQTIVQKEFIPEEDMKEKTIVMQPATKGTHKCATAEAVLTVGEDYPREVMVTPDLAVPVLLGKDLPLLDMIVSKAPLKTLERAMEKRWKEAKEILVVTRGQAKRKEETRKLKGKPPIEPQEAEDKESVSWREARQEGVDDGPIQEVFDFAEDLFLPMGGKTRTEELDREGPITLEVDDPKSKTEEELSIAELNLDGLITGEVEEPKSSDDQEGRITCEVEDPKSRKTFIKIQRADDGVQRWIKEENPDRMVKKGGLMFRKWKVI